MNTKQIKDRINRMMQEDKISPDQAVELMASVMSLIEVRALADDLTVAVVDKSLSEIGEGKLAADKAVELFDELRAMAVKEETEKARMQEPEKPDAKGNRPYVDEGLGDMLKATTEQALSHAREQIELAMEKLDRKQEQMRQKLKDKGFGKTEGDVVQEHYTANAMSAITGDLTARTVAVHGVLNVGGDMQAKDSLKVSGKLDCGGSILSGFTDIHGVGNCKGDMESGDLAVLGRLHCGGDMKYSDISVRGTVECTGDAAGEDFSISGKYKCGGDIRGKDIQVSGGLDCTGDLHADKINGTGTIHCCGDLKAHELVVSGKARGDGDVRADTVRVSGRLHSNGDISASKIHLSGEIKCHGDLKGDAADVSGRLIGDGDMRLGSLTVKEPHQWLEWITGGLIKDLEQVVCNGDLQVDGEVQARGRIVVAGKASMQEGYIEYLRAESVSLGPKVKAKYVEYRDKLTLAPGAEVLESVKVS